MYLYIKQRKVDHFFLEKQFLKVDMCTVIRLLIFTSYSFFFFFFVITLFLLPFYRLMISSVVSEFWSCLLGYLLLVSSCLLQKTCKVLKMTVALSLFRTMTSPALSSWLLLWVLSYNSFALWVIKSPVLCYLFPFCLKTVNLFSDLGPRIVLIHGRYSHIAIFYH